MNRPWQVWSVFVGCAVVVLSAMGWLSAHAIVSDWQRSQAQWEVQREQQIRLALWRMDTKLAPLIAEEAARPHYFYDSFFTTDQSPTQQESSSRWLPSPLLCQAKYVRLNFYNSGNPDQWSSPQIPDPEFGELARLNGLLPEQLLDNRLRLSELAKRVDPQKLLAQLPREQVPVLHASSVPMESGDRNEHGEGGYGEGLNASAREQLPGANDQIGDYDQQRVQMLAQLQAETQRNQSPQQIALPQARKSKSGKSLDYGQRSSRYQGVAQQEFVKQRSGKNYLGNNRINAPFAANAQAGEQVIESLSRPLWMNNELLLARRIVRDGQEGVQGSWLDWPNIQSELLAEVEELFPRASLKPLPDPELGDPARMLAGLPVELDIREEKVRFAPSSTLRWTLGLGWVALLTALGSVAALLWGVLSLSERRAAFVSSVTHELRTPLTTFRMYSDMLARDMVPGAAKRHEYLKTLQREAERLTHLVENVLSYARLERGRGPNLSEQVTVGDLIDRQQLRLSERAKQSGMELEVLLSDEVRGLLLTTDVSVVEQILFNLVDNAAKYAANAVDRRIELTANRVGKFAKLTVRDNGPGFDKLRETRQPRAFSKTAEEAAVSAPGVGLGLALCRRLAKQLGGQLEIGDSSQGATVSLALPVDGGPGGAL